MPTRIYLDHAATTPIRPQAEAAIREGMAIWANPSSPHAEGRKARAALEDARARIKASLGWDGELIFTSGASEGADVALGQAKGGARFVSQVEHEAVLKAAPDAERLPVRGDGALDLEELADALEGQFAPIVAVQAVNSETGNAQDIAEIAALVHETAGLLVVDAAQSAGKFVLPAEADIVIVSAHKLGGPPGIGALLVKDFAMLEPLSGQERGYRRGTENLPGAMGMAAALEACVAPYVDPDVLAPMEDFIAGVRKLGGTWVADLLAAPTPYIHAIAMPAMSGSAQLMRFDMAGFAVSLGSACSSGSLKQSHVLEAMALDPDLASRTIRVSVGWDTKREEVERFADAWIAMARQAAEKAA
jgi:cysteine desulfurase